jgi:predicted NodU family carbamoyl transferase
MEFGPLALGGRSIIGDARSPKMQSVMNLKIKYRESFRPFAPSVLRERLADYFEMDVDSPYMPPGSRRSEETPHSHTKRLTDDALLSQVADELAAEKVVGWPVPSAAEGF